MTNAIALPPPQLGRNAARGIEGLSSAEAGRQLIEHGRNELREHEKLSRSRVLLRQFRSPLLLLLVFAAVVAGMTGQWLDATIVVVIVLASVGLGFVREYHAQAAAEALRSRAASIFPFTSATRAPLVTNVRSSSKERSRWARRASSDLASAE